MDALTRELPKLKAALTRAKKTKCPTEIVAACDKALARFEEIGWPDNWTMWQRARDDAMFQIRMG